MSSSAASDLDNLPPSEMQLIDEACDRFEQAWRTGNSPNLEEYVNQAPIKIRKLLLQELLAIELPYRRQSGQSIASEDYTERFSELDVQRFRQINAKSIEAARQSAMNGLLSPLSYPQSGNVVLGDFRLIKEVGRGGMGIVYAAEQISLGRQVALKVLPSSQRLSSRHLQRFQNEARAAASLHHPNIVPVFAVGSEQGVHYYAMQLIDGPTLAEVVEENSQRSATSPILPTNSNESSLPKSAESLTLPLEIAQRMRTIAMQGIQAAEALEHAHSMGIVHRDVKPGNLMLDQSGKLWVTDFGLARIEADVNLTITGDMLGTLRFMSPEQALAKHGLVDHRTDIYSLGATLYELIANKPAIEGKDRSDILRKIAFEEPVALRKINPDIPRDLETIVLKSMSKEPRTRYQSAEELASDLRRFLDDRPIRARRRTKLQDLARWTRRNRVLAGAIATTVAVILAANVMVLWLWRSESKAHQELKDAQLATQKQASELRQSVYLQRIAMAEQELSHSSIGRAEQTLDRCQTDLRHWEWDFLKRSCNSYQMEFRNPNSTDLCVRFAPDGKRIACGYADGTIRIWDISTHGFTQLGTHSSAVLCIDFNSDGSKLASTAGDHVSKNYGEIKVWDLSNGQALLTIDTRKALVSSIDFSPDGSTLAIASWDSTIRLFNLETKSEQLLNEHKSSVKAISYSRDGKLLASGDWKGLVLVWDVATGQVAKRLSGHTADVLDLEFDNAGKKLVTSSWDGSAILWDPKSGEHIRTFVNAEILQRFGGSHNSVWSTSISPNGSTIATATEDGAIRLWNAATGIAQAVPRGHQGAAKGIEFSPDGKQVASVGLDGKLRIWDAKRTSIGQDLPIKLGMYSQIAYRPDGGCLVLASGPVPVKEEPGRIVFIYPSTGEPNKILAERSEGFRSVSLDPDSKILAADFGTSVRIWDAQTGDHLRDLEGSSVVNSVAMTAEQIAMAGDENGLVRIWNVRTGDLLESIQTELRSIEYLVAHRDGTTWAAASREGLVVVSRKQSREKWTSPKVINVGVIPDVESNQQNPKLAFSFAGHILAVGFVSGTIELWDTEKGKLLHKVEGHAGPVRSLCFSADGMRLASGGKDGTVVLWDTNSGQEALVLRKQLRDVAGVAFSPDNTSLAALEELANKVVIWNAELSN